MIVRILLNKYLPLLLLFLALFFPVNVNASNILLYEDFEDGIADNWEEIENICGQWNIQSISGNNVYVGTETNCLNPSQSIRTQAGDINWKDYTFKFKVKGVSGIDKAASFYRSSSGAYSVNIRSLPYGDVVLQHAARIIKTVNYATTLNEWYDVMIDTENREDGVQIKVFIDDMNNPIIDVVDMDESAPRNGKIGFSVWPGEYTGIISTTTAHFDSVIVNSKTTQTLNLPIDYPGRLEHDAGEEFLSAFNSRLTGVFDHNTERFNFTNYLGNDFVFPDCKKPNLNDHNLDCYDAHRGHDFDNVVESESVYPASGGVIVYATEEECTKDLKGYGCNIIIEHDFDDNHIYTLYGHLAEIYVETGDPVTEDQEIGIIGNTGFSSGDHLHFSVLKPSVDNDLGLNAFRVMSEDNWKSLVKSEVSNVKDKNNLFKPRESVCHHDENNLRFYFIDPSGWEGDGTDPWTESCNQENDFLWKYPLN